MQAGTLRWTSWYFWRKNRPGELWRKRGCGWRSMQDNGSRWLEDPPEVWVLRWWWMKEIPPLIPVMMIFFFGSFSFSLDSANRAAVTAVGLEGRWKKLSGELHPRSAVLWIRPGDGAVFEEASAGLWPPGHHCWHPWLGLVLSEANPKANPARDPARGGSPAAWAPHPVAGPASRLLPHSQETQNAAGSHRDPVRGRCLPPHHGALQLWGLVGAHTHWGAHPQRRAGSAKTAGVLWELLPRDGQQDTRQRQECFGPAG